VKEKITEIFNTTKYSIILYSIISVIACFFTLKPMMPEAGSSTIFFTVLVVCFSTLILKKNYSVFKQSINTVTKKVFAFLLFVYFNISLYGLMFLKTSKLEAFSFPGLFYVPMALIWTIPLFIQIMALMNLLLIGRGNQERFAENKPISFLVKIIMFISMMVNYAVWIYAFNPCITTSDSEYLFQMAHVLGKEPMENWHPPFCAMIYSYLLKICDSATFLVFVQCICYSVLLVQILSFFKKKGIRRIYIVFMYLFCGFMFQNVIQMITLWKDIPFMICILWLSFVLARIIFDETKVSILSCLELFFSLVGTCLFRLNGVVPAFAVLIAVGVYSIYKNKYRLFLPLVSFLIAYFVITGPVYNYYLVEESPAQKYYSLANDLVGTYYRIDDPSEGLLDVVNEVTDGNPEEYAFNSYFTNYNESALRDYSVGKFMKVYLETFLKHPIKMTFEIAKRNTVVWSIVKPEEEWRGCICELGEFHYHEDYEYVYPLRKVNAMTVLLEKMSQSFTNNGFLYVFSWRTGIYTVSLLFILFFAFDLEKKEYLIPFVPIVFNLVSLIIASKTSDYRYYWPTVMLFFFLLAYIRLVFERKVKLD